MVCLRDLQVKTWNSEQALENFAAAAGRCCVSRTRAARARASITGRERTQWPFGPICSAPSARASGASSAAGSLTVAQKTVLRSLIKITLSHKPSWALHASHRGFGRLKPSP